MQEILAAVVAHLNARHAAEPAVRRLLDRIDGLTPEPGGTPASPPHAEALASVLRAMRNGGPPSLARIADEVDRSEGRLPWRLERGDYYEPGAAVSDTYRDGNMNATLLAADDFVLGLFLLVADVDYLDHRHRAPEFYLNLTGPTHWRFDFGPWHSMPADSVLWNDPGRVHAMRTGAKPWLSVFAWLGDIDSRCEVVPE